MILPVSPNVRYFKPDGTPTHEFLRLVESIRSNKAYGTMYSSAAVTGPNISTGWTKVTAFNAVGGGTGVTFDTSADTWTFNNDGAFHVSFELILTHNESNSGRIFWARLQDGSSTADGVPVAVGRNQPGTNLSISFLQEVSADETFWLEVGNEDALTSVVWEAASVTVTGVG